MAVALQLMALLLGLAVTGLMIDGTSIVLLAAPVAVCGAIAFAYRGRADAPHIAIAAEAIAVLTATLAIGEVLTYPAALSGLPTIERQLYHSDLACGFDWLAYAHLVDRFPWLCTIAGLAYDSFNVQFIAIVALLVACRRIERLQVFLLATSVALSITCVIFAFYPAMSAFGYIVRSPGTLPNLYPSPENIHVRTLLRLDAALLHLRNGSLRHIAAADLVGLVTFPSFHTCAAFLFIWSSWDVRRLRIVVVALNLTMLAATPLYGGHYFADIIAGLVLTTFSIAASGRVLAWYRAAPRPASGQIRVAA